MRVNAVVHVKCDRCHKQSELKANTPVCKMVDNGGLTEDQKVKVVLFYAETKSVVATQETFSCTLWYKVGSLQTYNLHTLPAI